MIVVYPMLTSASISPNVLSGIVKAVEKYILLYNTDEVLRAAGGASAGKILSTGAKMAGALMAGEDKTGIAGEKLSEVDIGTTTKSTKKNPDTGESSSTEKRVQFSSDKNSIKPSLDMPRSEAVSLEPTWMNVTTQKKGMQILGVKVIPFTVKSNETMASMISKDTQLKFLGYLATKYGRAASRMFFRIMRKINVPILKDKAISGDPKKDVVFGETQYGKNLFICLNQLDLDNDEMFSNPTGVQKLHKLGWASFIIMDDVNKRATFCMKEFGGICSVVPYGFMFASLGKEVNKVYEDMEDLKKSSGPFFNMRTNRKQIFSEGNITPVDKYLQLIQDK